MKSTNAAERLESVVLPAVLRGMSPAAVRQMDEVEDARRRTGPVLITAASGLEPESVAVIVHGVRAGHPFLVVDCAGASPEDLHLRLFGAADITSTRRRDLETARRAGALVDAGSGTVLLTSLGELPAGVQRRLARALRDNELYLQDARQPFTLQARVIAIATPDLADDVAAGRFRADLFRRLGGCRVSLAPLAERPEDVPEIVRAVAGEIAARAGVAPKAFTTAALTALAALPWSRNLIDVRELVERLHASDTGDAARQEDVLRQIGFGRPSASRPARFDSLRDARKRFEREYIGAVLARHEWRMAEAATTLGIERANLYRKVRQLGLSRPSGL